MRQMDETHLAEASGAYLMDDERSARADASVAAKVAEEEVKSVASSRLEEVEEEAEDENRKQASMDLATSREAPAASEAANSVMTTSSSSVSTKGAEMSVDVAGENGANTRARGSSYLDQGFTISWRNLNFVVESKWYKLAGQRKPILDGLSGSFKSGELSAVLGPSGAGKSTLIDCLLGKHERGLSGQTRVTFNKLSCELERRKRRPLKIALIPQQDHLLDSLTVTETFMFASKIKNAHVSYEDGEDEIKPSTGKQKKGRAKFDHFANVQRVIQRLNLASCAGMRCGKLSGGQYKRVSIGQELLSGPDLMILDEPTSGLDSVTCYQTISALRALIDSSPYPMAIVATIHQPDVEVFNLFHMAYVLAEGGRAIFEGPSERIFDSVQHGLELVESRWKRRRAAAGHLASMLPGRAAGEKAATTAMMTAQEVSQVQGQSEEGAEVEQRMQELRRQLAQRSSNPARLVVEVAACEFGYEIASAMNDIHRQSHSSSGHAGTQLDTPAHKFERNQDRAQHLVDSVNTISSRLSSSCSELMFPQQTTIQVGDKQADSVVAAGGSRAGQQAAQPSWPLFSLAPGADRPRTRSSSGKLSESSSDSSIISSSDGGSKISVAFGPPQYDYEANAPGKRRPELDKLLNLVAANVNRRRPWSVHLCHLAYHTRRSWMTIVRDPMLFSVQLGLHILVPLLISYAFAFHGSGNDACPKVGPLDIIEEAYREEGNVLDDVNRELRIAFENLGYIFFQLYVIIFAAVCCTSLTYPLAMHVLLKEYRNGWYSMSSYFLGRTLADLPIPTLNVVLAMAISYHLTGQAHSPYAWRFASVAALTVLASLVAQTQGLMFGAMLMNLPQSAVFVAPASTAPLVVVSGFLLRIKSLPSALQVLSQLSYFTHLLNGFIISRYGFNRCPCDESLFDAELAAARQIPLQARALIDLWAESFADELTTTLVAPNTTAAAATTTMLQLAPTVANGTMEAVVSTLAPPPATTGRVDLLGKLMATISRAKSYGFQMNQCNQVKPFTMLDYELDDSDLYLCFGALALLLLLYRWLTYAVLSWKISGSI